MKRKTRTFEECHRLINGTDHKQCSICEKWYPCNSEFFYANKLNKTDGYYPYCKKCTSERNMNWESDNKEKVKSYRAKTNQRPKRIQEKREAAKQYRLSGGLNNWKNNNPDKVCEYGKNHNKKKHKITDIQWDECRIYFNFRCAYCGKTWEQNKKETKKDLHREHVDDNGANDLSNCVPSCRDCNSHKWEFEFEDWYNENNVNYTYEKYEKILKWINEDHKQFL